MEIGKKIYELRTSKMMTQAELAGDCITRNMLCLIEKGAAMPSLQSASYIANKLGVSVGYLLSEEKEEHFYRKLALIDNIKRAYSEEAYNICRDLCMECVSNGIDDDEIKLVLAECYIKIAEEEIAKGSLKVASEHIYEALRYSNDTIYDTQNIEILAAAYSEYMSYISPTLDVGLEKSVYYIPSDDFYEYIYVFCNFDRINIYNFCSEAFKCTFYYTHLEAMDNMKNGNFRIANDKLENILRSDAEIPRTVLYSVFSDLEKCCKENDNFKGAYEYSSNRIRLFEKMLSEN